MALAKTPWKKVALIGGGVTLISLFGLWLYRRGQRNLLAGERIPAWFVDPNSGDVIELDQQTAHFRTARDFLPGGRGDFRRDADFDPQELDRGIKVEMEHTRDREIAKEIAKDHLTEDPSYYLKLKAIHLDGYNDEDEEDDDDEAGER